MNILKVLLSGLILLPLFTFGQGITVSTGSGLDLELSGEVELEFIDVEGAGGFANQDLTYQKVRNRSPHMRIDMAVLGARVNYSENLSYNIEFRFDDESAYVDKQYARLNVPGINTQFEMGKNRPFVSRKRQSEGYPLVGTAFWKGREAHINGTTEIMLGEKGKLTGGLSFAMKRPLGTDDAAEDKSFKMMVYDDYEPKNGQTFEYGVKAGIDIAGISLLGWYFMGELIDDWDWKASLKQSLAPYSNMGDETDVTHYWMGGRAAYKIAGLNLVGEYIRAQDGLLTREGAYGEASYSMKAPSFLHAKGLTFLGRQGFLNLVSKENSAGEELTWAYLSEAMSWDRQMTTLSAMLEINDNLTLKFEHYILGETTGSDIESSVDDDQTLLQINFRF
ncbi:MAG: hypothetical protein H8E26_05800 [FCB group bacterium]|nr:hypothetical protein [FCB group bacterium]MBL7027581.1 hypothetical protein [Candidatus Neomarinimicrobiota bacterium]MBL7121211.1 hypothetical protein [Candidatus Neomarinimicrobiota bacterium]